MKPTIRIYDSSFPEHKSSVPGKSPEHFNWVRGEDGSLPISVYTHDEIYKHAYDFVPKGHTRIAWLFESVEICPQYFNLLFGVADHYDFIFTYYKPWCEFDPRFRWVPAMGTWIEGSMGGGLIKPYPKSKLCSMVTSDKKFTPLQRYRCHVADTLRSQGVDIYGYGNHIATKLEGLADYMFSVAIENSCQPGYFTEKLLDCIAVGTIPVYHGDPYIAESIEPIIKLADVLSGKVTLSPELYQEMLPSVMRGLDSIKPKGYDLPENYMWNNILQYIGTKDDSLPNIG